jgi:uncharacterized protein (TIGR00369 family)
MNAPLLPQLRTVPLMARLGLSARATDAGVEAEVELDERWGGTTATALAALLCDSATGSAVALLEPDRMISTVVLNVETIAPPPRSGLLRALARTAGRRGDFVFATSSVRAADGTEFAHATSWWAVRGPRPQAPPPPTVSAVPHPGTAVPDPAGSAVARYLGLGKFTRADGEVSFDLTEIGALRNRSGTLHGGVGALLAQLAAVHAVDDGTRVPEVLSMTCAYLRAAAGSGPVRISGSRIRRGRTTAVADATVAAPDGRPAMRATVTMDLGPDGSTEGVTR